MAYPVATNPFFKSILKRIVTITVSWFTVLACLVVTFMGMGIFFLSSSDMETEGGYSYVYGDGTQSLLSIPVSGTIMGTQVEGGFLGLMTEWQTPGYHIKEQLYTAAADNTIKGVILEIESPGGTIYGSRAIADGVAYYKEKTGNPVYTYVEGLAASGAYWAAASTDEIIADYGSEVGSIGVVMGPFQYFDQVVAADDNILGGGVITQNGIEYTTITAGKSKDMGSPYRRLTDEEIRTLQQSVNDEYDTFVRYVAEHRNIPESTLRNTIGALTYGNKAAEQHKLIDKTGSRETAYGELAKAADIENDYQVIREEYIPSFVESLLMATGLKQRPQVKADTCSLVRGSLAYHGDLASLCKPE